jgi:uncharacterized protein (DUF2267 family)
MGWDKRRNQSYAALRVVLHELRDRLTVEEAADFAAQLPLLIKGIFYDGWRPAAVPRKIDREQFLEDIRTTFRFSMDRSIDEMVHVVLQALRKHVSEGELEDIRSILPRDLASMLGRLDAVRTS